MSKLFINNQIKFRSGRLEILGVRDSFTPTKTYVEILRQLIVQKKENLIYWSAKDAGVMWFERMARVFPGLRVREAMNWGIDFIALSGWGSAKLERFDIDKKSAVFLLENSSVVRLFGKSDTAVDHLFRGLVAGALTFALKSDIDAVEVSCIARGDKVCKFIFAPKELLVAPEKVMTAQLSKL